MRRFTLPFAGLMACASYPPSGRHVEVAELVGAEVFDEDEVLEGLRNHPPDGLIFIDYAQYEPLALELDKKRIASFYAKRGYFSAQVISVEVDVGGEGAHLTFRVDEGQPSLLQKVELRGAPPALESALQRALDLPLNEPFRYEPYVATKARLRRRLMAAGYAFARVDGRADVDRDERTVEVIITLDPGPLVRVGAIEVEGLEDLPREFVEARLSFAEGDIFDPDALDSSRARMLQTGLVESVRFRWDRETRTERVDLVVAVSRGPLNELRLGAGGGRAQNLQIRARAGYARKSLFDPRLTLAAEVRPSYEFIPGAPDGPAISATVEVTRQDFILPLVVGTAELSYGFVQREAYHTNGPSTAGTLSRPFFDDRLRVGARLEYEHFDVGVDDLLEPLLEADGLRDVGIVDPLRTLFVEPFVTFEGRDNPVNPTSGFVADLRLETGTTLGGGLGPYMLLIPEARGYVEIVRQLVAAARVRFGTRIAGGPVPITRRFFTGGPESQRGFNRRRLAPRHPSANRLPIGGESMLEANLELRLDIVRVFDQWFGIVAFLDGADATRTLADLDITNLHWAVGGGLRYRTPVGPIRVDVGVRLNRRGDLGDSAWAFHLSLGEAF